MAVTYENVLFDRVISGLHTLIADEFSIPILFDEHEGNQSFLITPVSDSLIDFAANSQTRDYAVEISYQVQSSGDYTKNVVKQITEMTERLKRLLYNNSAYSPSDSYKWHDGRVQSIEYSRNEDDNSIINSVTGFECTIGEVIG
jgi:nucleoside-diphosphate-sugar epimerase|tara:strand:+ start:637 stop:1068 length:432 start_codon:yes stop_codon:yes gene_type:complete